MSTLPFTVLHRDADLLAKATAARIVTRLVDAQATRGTASIVLTGGGIGTAVLTELASTPARDAVDWNRLNVWWGDERFLPKGHPERNETGARSALLDHVNIDHDRVHPMPAHGGHDGVDPERGADRYAADLLAMTRPEDSAGVPSFDILLLGIGPDAHVASLFPEHPALHENERTVVAVRDSPKPPSTRVTLTLPAIRASREVWLLASGANKADAVRHALGESRPIQVPAAGARGGTRTLFLVDRAAARRIPEGMGCPGQA